MSNVIRAESEDENEERVDGNDPEDVFEEDERAVKTEETLPSQLFVGTNARTPIHGHGVPSVVLLGITYKGGGHNIILSFSPWVQSVND